MRRRPLFLGLAVLALGGLLGACADEEPEDASPTSTAATETSTATPTATPTASPPATETADATPGATPFAGAEGDIEYAEAATEGIEGLTSGTDSQEGESYSYSVTWPELEGFPLLGEESSAQVAAWREAFEEEFGPPVAGSPIVQEFTTTHSFLVASGDVIGVRFQVFEFPGAGGANLSRTLWFDLASGEAVPATALLDGDTALEQLSEITAEALRRDRPDLTLPDALAEGTAPSAENYHSLGFTSDGDLVVEFDEYQVGPGASGSPRVMVPADVAAPLLSDFGLRAQAEAMSPSESLELPG